MTKIKTPEAICGRVFNRERPPLFQVNSLSGGSSRLETMPIAESVLTKWDAGIQAAAGDTSNVIEIYDIIGEDWWSGGGVTDKMISSKLNEFGSSADVEVRINSPGGDMFQGIAIYNILQQHKGNITVKITALAASAASIIAMAGNEILMGQGAFLMIHNAWVMAMGNRNDFRDVADWLEPFDYALRDIYAARSGLPPKDIIKMMDKETFLNAQDAIDLKLADGTLSEDQITENAKARESQKAFNAARAMEHTLCKKDGNTRSQARQRIAALKNLSMPGAAQPTKPGAGDDWMEAARDFIAAHKL